MSELRVGALAALGLAIATATSSPARAAPAPPVRIAVSGDAAQGFTGDGRLPRPVAMAYVAVGGTHGRIYVVNSDGRLFALEVAQMETATSVVAQPVGSLVDETPTTLAARGWGAFRRLFVSTDATGKDLLFAMNDRSLFRFDETAKTFTVVGKPGWWGGTRTIATRGGGVGQPKYLFALDAGGTLYRSHSLGQSLPAGTRGWERIGGRSQFADIVSMAWFPGCSVTLPRADELFMISSGGSIQHLFVQPPGWVPPPSLPDRPADPPLLVTEDLEKGIFASNATGWVVDGTDTLFSLTTTGRLNQTRLRTLCDAVPVVRQGGTATVSSPPVATSTVWTWKSTLPLLADTGSRALLFTITEAGDLYRYRLPSVPPPP